MFVYFDQNGTLKEIITEKTFRVGDSKRDKIYVYWDGEHSPISGWVKYRKPDGTEYPISVEECFYQFGTNQLVGKALPTKPLRNLKYFSYDHTYEENGETHIGYKFYEITVPDAVLNISNDDEKEPTQNNMIIARIRFVMDDGTIEGEVDEADSIETLGAIVFSVETNIGILTDSSINETQYNYLISLIGLKMGLNISSEKVEELPETGVAGKIYYVQSEENGIIYDAYMWNGTQFVFMGTTSYDLYTKQEGEDFETAIQALWNAELADYKAIMNSSWEEYQTSINAQIAAQNLLIQAAASGTPRGTYATLTALRNANPNHSYIYITLSTGNWYYWNTEQNDWVSGGQYLSTGGAVPTSRTIAGIDLVDDITADELTDALSSKEMAKIGFGTTFPDLTASDLNDYDFGFYLISSDKYMNATNRPNVGVLAGGVVLKVERAANNVNYKKQTLIFPIDNSTYVRYYNHQTATWSEWTFVLENIKDVLGVRCVRESTASGTNLNNLTTPNIYRFSYEAALNGTNFPAALSCVVYVLIMNSKISGTPPIFQLFASRDGFWFRYANYINGSYVFTEWRTFANDAIQKSTSLVGISESNVFTDAVERDVLALDLGVYMFNTPALAVATNIPEHLSGPCVVKISKANPTGSLKRIEICFADAVIWNNIQYFASDATILWRGWKKTLNQDDLYNINPDVMPSYWDSEISATISTVAGYDRVIKNHGDKFLLMTDNHYPNNFEKTANLLKTLSKKVGTDLVASLGDVIVSSLGVTKSQAYEGVLDFYSKFDISFRFLIAIGNHDVNRASANTDNSTWLDGNDLYQATVHKSEKFTDTKGNVNYYYDNESQKIRYVVFEHYSPSVAFSQDLKDFLTASCSSLSSDWTIVLMSHCYTYYEDATDQANAAFITSLNDSINATIACWLVGHTHFEYSYEKGTTKKWRIIGFNADTNTSGHTSGTSTEQTIYVVQIDTQNKQIYTTCCGYGTDRGFTYGS